MILFMDGFDHYATADMPKKWTTASNVTIVSSGGRRNGGYCSQTSSAAILHKVLPTSYATLIMGFAFQRNTTQASVSVASFLDGATEHLSIKITPVTFTLSVYRGATLLATGTTSIVPGTWYYLEFKATIHDTTGSYTLRLNGVTELTASGIDTRNGGNSSANIINLSHNNSVNFGGIYDDFYCCDTSGSTNNDFLGDCRIDTLYPTGAGNYTQFTPSAGANWTTVDETAPNTTDYNDGLTIGDRDSYGMGNLAAVTSQTIYGVQVNAAVLKDDAGTKSMSTMVRSGTTDADGVSVVLGTSQLYVSQVFETNPNGAVAWTETTVNAMEAGVRVTA